MPTEPLTRENYLTEAKKAKESGKFFEFIERESKRHPDKMVYGMYLLDRLLLDSVKRLYNHLNLGEIDYEDLFSRLRLVQNGCFPELFSELIRNNSKWPQDLERNLKHLLHWVGYLWEEAVDFESGESRTYMKFVEQLQPKSDSIISFNQDNVLEHALEKSGKYFTYQVEKNLRYPYLKQKAAEDIAINIYKMHGSFDWVLVYKSEEASMRPENKLFDIEYEDEKRKDKSPTAIYKVTGISQLKLDETLKLPRSCWILTPDAFKGIPKHPTDRHFIELYNLSLEELQTADQVIIVGFAARAADTLAAVWLNIGLQNKRADQIMVIDPSDNVPIGISRNIEKFTYVRKTFHQWIIENLFVS